MSTSARPANGAPEPTYFEQQRALLMSEIAQVRILSLFRETRPPAR
ncbi:MAG: hypothetical protein INR71_02705 [Terriglobus roseus]|nr:hypothetical protein [Terriglobus roseus]